MTLRQRLFIISSIVLAIILAILLYLLYGRKPGTSVPATGNQPANSTNPTTNDPTNKDTPAQVSNPIITLPAYSEDLYVRQLTKIFVERFASYSTQNDNSNIKDSLELATVSMQAWMKAQMKPGSQDYEGAVTQVLASSLKEKTATSATVAIQIQQTFEQKKATTTGATSKEIRQKKGTVKLVKVGDQWKVDALYWE